MQLYFGSRLQSDFQKHGVRPLRDDLPSFLSVGAQFETDWMSRLEMKQVRAAWKDASVDGGKRIVS